MSGVPTPGPLLLPFSAVSYGYSLERLSQQLAQCSVATVLKEAAGVAHRQRLQLPAHRLDQHLAGTSLGLAHQRLELGKFARLGNVACEAGEYARASRLYEVSFELGRRIGMNHSILTCLEELARVAVAQGKDGTRSVAVWDGRRATRRYRLIPPSDQARRARAYRGCDPRVTWGIGVCCSVGKMPRAAFGGGHH
jgi:hypothetical protein